MDRKEDLDATGERFRDLIVGDPRASDEIRRGRAVFLEEVERRNAPRGLPSPVRAPSSPMVAARRCLGVRRGGRGGRLDPDAAGDLSDR